MRLSFCGCGGGETFERGILSSGISSSIIIFIIQTSSQPSQSVSQPANIERASHKNRIGKTTFYYFRVFKNAQLSVCVTYLYVSHLCFSYQLIHIRDFTAVPARHLLMTIFCLPSTSLKSFL